MPLHILSPDLKAKWLAALRSGSYIQGFGELHLVDGTYCALGVLHEVAGRPRPRSPYDWTLTILGPRNLEIVRLNDRERFSFAQIADWIETHF